MLEKSSEEEVTIRETVAKDGQLVRAYYDFFEDENDEDIWEFRFIEILGASNGNSTKKTYKFDDETQEPGELLKEESIPVEPIRELGKWKSNAWHSVSDFTRMVPYVLPFIALWLTVLFWYSYWFTSKNSDDVIPAWTKCLGNIRYDNSLQQAEPDDN